MAESALGPFGLDGAGERWIEQIRAAEAPLPFGGLGQYELAEEMGRGGQGVVYRAVRRGDGRQVALKRLLGGAFASASMRRRFEREIEALSALHHPHIVCAYAMDVVDGAPVLVMEWIDGVPITEWAGRGAGRRDLGAIVAMLLEVCDAVRHAHQRGVLHRDLKPSNILIDGQGHPRLLDFGLAKMTGSAEPGAAELSTSGEFVGTLAYASPEQLAGGETAIDVRSDVFALGVVLYEMVTGRPAFDVGNDRATARAAMAAGASRPSSLAAGVDRDLEAIILKAIAVERGGRYQSVEALASDLEAWRAGGPVSARVPGRFRTILRSLRRHWLAASIAASVFALVAAGAIVAALLAAELAQQRDRARTVNTFLEEMLASVDPMRAGGEVTVRQVLDAAGSRVTEHMVSEPVVEASLRRVLGVTYHSLGLLEEAEPHLRRAVELESGLHEGDHPDLAAATNELGHLMTSRGRYAEAEELLREALRMRVMALGDEHADVAVSLNNLAKVMHLQGRIAAAEPLWRQALDIRRARLGPAHALTASSLHNLGACLFEQGDPAAAEALLREALDVVRAAEGDEHVDVAFSQHMLARVVAARGRVDEAEALFRQSLEIKRRTLLPAHAAIGFTLEHLGRLLVADGRLDEGQAMIGEALEVYRQSLGDEHANVASALMALGRTHAARGERAQAREMLLEALEMNRRCLGEEHPAVGECAAALAELEGGR